MDVVIDWLLSQIADGIIATYKGIATTIWWIIKAVNTIATYITTESLWADTLDTLLTSISAVMPDVFSDLVYAPTGIMYVAFSLSGILLIINRGGAKNKIADPAQVIIWGVFLSVLFVSGSAGYDLIGGVEQMRLNSANLALSTIAPNGEIGDLVAVPMRASIAESVTTDFALPAQFEADFFQEADPANINTQQALIYDSFLLGPWEIPFDIEDENAQQARKELAVDGLLITLLTIGPAAVEGMFAVIYAAIAAAAFILIVFFLSVLPLGFFSFGREIIESIIKQYFTLWLLSLASSVVIGILLGSGSLFLTANPTINTIVTGYLPILMVMSIAITYMMKLAFNVVQGTSGMVTATIRDEIGASAYNTRMPAAGEVPLSNAANAGIKKAEQIATLATGAMSGGLSMLALGGIASATGGSVRGAVGGSLMAQARPEAARDAAMLARYTSESQIAQSFAATAMGRNFIPAAVGLLATRPEPEAPKGWASEGESKQENSDRKRTQIERMIDRPELAPAGADHGAMAAIKKIAEANELNLSEVMKLAKSASDEAKRDGDNVPDAIYKRFEGADQFKSVEASAQAELARNADLMLQSLEDSAVKAPAETPEFKAVDEATEGEPANVRIVEDDTQRDALAQKVEVVNQPEPETESEESGFTGERIDWDNRDQAKRPEAEPFTVDEQTVSEMPEPPPFTPDQLAQTMPPPPANFVDRALGNPDAGVTEVRGEVSAQISRDDSGTKDVRVVEDQTQRDMAATKVEVVNQPEPMEQKAEVVNQTVVQSKERPHEKEELPETPEPPPFLDSGERG